MFFDTIKYFQQSLGTLACNLTDSEKLVIRTECKNFLNKDENLSKKFNVLTEKDKKGCLTNYQGDNSLWNDNKIQFIRYLTWRWKFFSPALFFLALMTVDENVKKFYQTMKLKDVELSLIKSIISKTYNSLWNIWTMIWTTSKAF